MRRRGRLPPGHRSRRSAASTCCRPPAARSASRASSADRRPPDFRHHQLIMKSPASEAEQVRRRHGHHVTCGRAGGRPDRSCEARAAGGIIAVSYGGHMAEHHPRPHLWRTDRHRGSAELRRRPVGAVAGDRLLADVHNPATGTVIARDAAVDARRPRRGGAGRRSARSPAGATRRSSSAPARMFRFVAAARGSTSRSSRGRSRPSTARRSTSRAAACGAASSASRSRAARRR